MDHGGFAATGRTGQEQVPGSRGEFRDRFDSDCHGRLLPWIASSSSIHDRDPDRGDPEDHPDPPEKRSTLISIRPKPPSGTPGESD
jgi:hypothetical protein